MAVSYTDYGQPTLQSSPYTQPIDLNLLGRVLSVKQQQFDQAGQQIQTGINNLGKMDLLRNVDKTYANSKINDLVSQLNSSGSLDLSDQTISSQVESLGSNIYNDPNIVSGLAATASIRSLQAGYQKYKTDPKSNKLYSQANEWNDMQPVSEYLSNTKLGASYNGSATPTPYVPYKDNLIKNIQGMKANLNSIETGKGMVWTTGNYKVLSPDQIIQAAKDMSSADEVAQMQRDGLYQFRNIDPQTLLQKSLDINNGKIITAQSKLSYYQSMTLQASDDPAAKQRYTELSTEAANEVKSLQSLNPKDLVKAYQADPNGFKSGVYMDEFYRGLGSRFAVNETTTKNQLNPVEAFTKLYQQRERFHSDEMQMKMAGLELKYDKDGKPVKAGAEGETTFTTEAPNTNDPNEQITGEKAIDLKNKDLTDLSTAAWNKYYTSLLTANPEFKTTNPSQLSGSGITVGFKNQKLFENFNGQPGLQPEDLNISPDSGKYDYLIKKGISSEQLKFMNDLYLTYEQQALGKDQGITNLPKGAKETFETIANNQSAINANQAKVSSINGTLKAEYGVTPQAAKDLDIMVGYAKRYQTSQDIGRAGVSSIVDQNSLITNVALWAAGKLNILPGVPLTPEEKSIVADPTRLGNVLKTMTLENSTAYTKEKKAYYDAPENRPQFEMPVLTSEYLGKMNIEGAKKMFAINLHDQTGTTVSEQNVELTRPGRNADGTYTLEATIKSADGKSVDTKTVRLNAHQVAQIGLQQTPYQAITDEATISGSIAPRLWQADRNQAKGSDRVPISAKFVVYRNNPEDRNDLSSSAYLVDETGKKIAEIPGVNTDRPDKTYAAVKSFLQTAEDSPAILTRQDMIDFITDPTAFQKNHTTP